MNQNAPAPTVPFALTLAGPDLAALPPEVGIGLAHSLCERGRVAEGLATLNQIAFEAQSQRGAVPYYWNCELSNLFDAAIATARCAGPGGVRALIDGIETRARLAPHEKPTSAKHASAPDRMELSSHCANVWKSFSDLAQHSPDDALELVLRAPAWLGLHGMSEERLSHTSEGFSQALRGAWRLDVARAYFEHDHLVTSLLNSNPQFNVPRAFIARLARDFDPILDEKSVDSFAHLLRLCVAAASPAAAAHPTLSPLPGRWISSLMLGRFEEGRKIVIQAFGFDRCLLTARKEAGVISESIRAFESGDSLSVERAAECFGAEDALGSQNIKLQKSAVARMAKSMDPRTFAHALDHLIASGARGALELSCAHRFWVVNEQSSTVRKLGDALAFCAAEGRLEHAEALLSRLPGLDRKPVKEVLVYMHKRHATNRDESLAAWETLLLREITKTLPAPASLSRRARL